MTEPMPMCPMAGMCKGMRNRRRAGIAMFAPGVVFILLGIVVLIEPRILVWLVAIALIVMGVAMLTFGRFMRKIGQRFLSDPHS